MKTLKTGDVFSLVAGSMIGSGIFLVSSGILRDTGHPGWLLLIWALAGFVTIAGALSYAELAALFPEDGGQMVFIQKAWGNSRAFAYGICVVFVIQTGVIAAVATAFALYLSEIPLLMGWKTGNFSTLTIRVIAVLMIFFLSFIQWLGQQKSSFVQRFFTFVKVLALLFVILLGAYAFIKNPSILQNNFSSSWELRHFSSGTQTITTVTLDVWIWYFFSAFIGALFSMDAWNNVTFVAARVERPEKTLPAGLISGVLTVTLLYLLTNLAYLSMLPSGMEEGATNTRSVAFCEAGRVATASLSVFFDRNAALIIAVLIVISTFGCNNGIIFSGGVFIQSMAKKHWLPSFLSKEGRRKTPGNALFFQALWASLLVFTGSYSDLLVYATFCSLVFYIITISGLFRLRKTHGHLVRTYQCPGYPVIPVLYIVITGMVCVSLLVTQTRNSLTGLIFPAVAMLVYRFLPERAKITA